MPLSENGFPVMLTFDFDAETLWTSRDPANRERPITLSQGRYGWNVGIGRVLDLLEAYSIPATFFVPGQVIVEHGPIVDRILANGHEIAHHSWSHQWVPSLAPSEEREEFERGIETILRATGLRPRGYRCPAAEISALTLPLLVEHGFSYSSNFLDDDAPYLHRVDGQVSDLVELPFAWVLDDAPFFLYSLTIPGRTMHPPSAVLEAWSAEFAGLYAEDKQMTLVMHPQIIGRPSRIAMLEAFIHVVRSKPGVWFARCDQVADAIRPALLEQARSACP